MESTVNELSLLPVPPVLHNIPMVEVNLSVGLYAVFRVWPVHALSHGVNRLLKECFMHMLCDNQKTTNAMHK